MNVKLILGLPFLISLIASGLAIEKYAEQNQINDDNLSEKVLTPEEVTRIFGNSSWILPDDWLEGGINKSNESNISTVVLENGSMSSNDTVRYNITWDSGDILIITGEIDMITPCDEIRRKMRKNNSSTPLL